MSQDNMSVFTTQLYHKGDLLKNWMFEIRIEPTNPNSSLTTILGNDYSEDLRITARTAAIPEKSFGELATEFMGSKLLYPGKANISGDLSVSFDEFQGMENSRLLYMWQNLMFNQNFGTDAITNLNDINTGGAASNDSKDYSATITVLMVDSTTKKHLPVGFKFYRCWPKTVASVELGYEQEAKVQRVVTFSYSHWDAINV